MSFAMVIAFLFFRRLVEVSPEMVELEKQKKKCIIAEQPLLPLCLIKKEI